MNKNYYDANGQPESGFHLANNEIKAINTLYGLIMGITADQVVTDQEIHFLNLWLKDNDPYTKAFPLNIIKHRVNEILADGVITQDERDNFYQVLTELSGNDFYKTGAAGGFSNGSIFENPSFLTIRNSYFCLTGAFVSGPREKCERAIMRFGGLVSSGVSRKINYLVVGTLSSRDWIATGHGRKIEKALHYQQKGVPIGILSEESLLSFMKIK